MEKLNLLYLKESVLNLIQIENNGPECSVEVTAKGQDLVVQITSGSTPNLGNVLGIIHSVLGNGDTSGRNHDPNITVIFNSRKLPSQ